MRPRDASPATLGAFWFGIQMVWGALLGIALQARAAELAPHRALAAYATMAIAGAAVAALTQIVAGIISDRRAARGRTGFYMVGAVAGAASLGWFFLAPSFAQLVAALVLLQIALNVAIGPYQAAIPDFIEPRNFGKASSWMALLQNTGNIAGVLAAAFLKSVVATVGAIDAVLLIACAVTVSHVRRLSWRGTMPITLRIERTFTDLFVSRALVYTGFYTLLGYLYFYVAGFTHSGIKTQTGIFQLIFLGSAAAGAALSGRLADRAERRNVATIGGSIFALALVAFLFANTSAQAVPAVFLAGAGWGVFLTADWALGCAFLPRGALATAMGVWNLALLIPQIVAPSIATIALQALHALQNANAPRIAFIVAAVEVAGGLGWLRRLPASKAALNDCRPSGNNG